MWTRRRGVLAYRVAAGAFGVFGCVCAGTPVAQAQPLISTPPPCHASFFPYVYTRSALAACGIPTYPLSRVVHLPGGGNRYEYDIPGGHTYSTVEPPAGFTPLTATTQQLAEYDFPPRPSNLDALAVWSAEMRAAKVAPPTPYIANTASVAPVIGPQVEPNPLLYPAGTDAGYITYAEAPNTYTSVDDGFYSPRYGGGCANPAVGVWDGIGNAHTAFGQAGVSQTGAHDQLFAQFWINVGNADLLLQNYDYGVIAANDYVVAYVSWNRAGTFSGFLQDVTTGDIHGFSYYTGGASGVEAEALLEEPGPPPGQPAYGLDNFGTETFYSTSVNGQTPGPVVKYDAFGNGVNLSGLDSIGGFSETWKHC